MGIGVFLKDQHRHLRFYLSMHIRQKRKALGLSVDDMVERLGISGATYARIEAGRNKIDEDLLQKISDILQLSDDDLFELFRIANIAQANAYAQEFSSQYPV